MIQRHLMGLWFLCIVLCSALSAQENTPPAKPSTPAATQGNTPQDKPSTPAAAQEAVLPAKSPTPADTPAGSDLVVVKVFGEPVTEKQVLTEMGQLSREKQLPVDPKQPRSVFLYQGAIDNIITTAVMKNQAKQLNVAADKAKVDQQMEMIQKQFKSSEEFQKALAGQGLTEARLRQNVEETMRMQQLVEQATNDIPQATADEVQKFYDENPKNFVRQEQIHVAHILLMVDKKSTPEQKAEIKKQIDEIRADIEANKITFEDAAAKFSQDKSNAAKGGDLGFFPRGRMVKSFEEAAFAGQPGTMTPVVESDYGFHIIKIIEKKPSGTVTFEEAKTKIQQYLDAANRRTATQKYVADLKAKAAVETFMTAEEFLKRHPEVR